MSKRAALLLIVILTVSSLILVNLARADVTKPSIPEFSLKIEDQSYDVAPTYTKDPYTGETKVATGGYHVEKKFINVIIQNPTVSYYGVVNSSEIKLYYSIRVKGHFQEWADGRSQTNIVPDNAQVTTVAFGFGSSNPGGFSIWLGDIAAGGQVDFQVKAVNGYYTKTTTQDPVCFRDTELNIFTETGQSSWSDTKTIIIPANTPLSSTPSSPSNSTPDQTTDPTPETPQTLQLEAILGTVIALAIVGAGLLIYFKKRKH